jgi:hypothetical protein
MSTAGHTTFSGFVKQMSVADLSEAQTRLFAAMFPNFFDRTDFSWDRHVDFQHSFEDVPVKFVPYRVPRRYGGMTLPRGRYSTLCENAGGDDYGTLANELGAYRDVAVTGGVSILDFGIADQRTVPLRDRQLEFEAAHEIGIMLFEWERLADLIQLVPHIKIEIREDYTTRMLRYPYRVTELRLDRVVDLRRPGTRAWLLTNSRNPTTTGGGRTTVSISLPMMS